MSDHITANSGFRPLAPERDPTSKSKRLTEIRIPANKACMGEISSGVASAIWYGNSYGLAVDSVSPFNWHGGGANLLHADYRVEWQPAGDLNTWSSSNFATRVCVNY